MLMNLIRRHIAARLIRRLEEDRVIVLTGARQTGKTTLCERIIPADMSRSFQYISFDDPDERLRFQRSAVSSLEALDAPLIILDEVQKIPSLFDPLKLVIDALSRRTGERRYFILTGSSQLVLMKNIRETLAGRVGLLHLYPFSFAEAAGGGQEKLLTTIWRNLTVGKKDAARISALSAEERRRLIRIRDEHQQWGGYPPVWQRTDEAAKMSWLKDYRKTYLERDIADVGQVANIDTFALAQKLLCARTGRLLSLSEVARDLALTVNTVKRYVDLLVLSFQCLLLRPYFVNIGKRFVKSPKIFFPDSGLIRAILGETGLDGGPAYESWFISELLKWKQLLPVEPEIYFYRTAAGMEVDFLIEGEGKLLPVEVKSSRNVGRADGRALESFLSEYKKAGPIGLIVYRGNELAEIRKNIWAVPDWALLI
jgi:hypothetical protein